jgi:peptidoglycan/xylan/chitin deacetylase (PgdA/CDA1 family)
LQTRKIAAVALMRNLMKKTIGLSIRCMPPVRHALKRGLTVFVFHEVSDHPSEFARQFGLSVSTATFRRQASWIKANFNVVHPSALLDGAPLPERAAVISFDDGFLGTFRNGLAILEQLGLPSVLFLNMHAILERRPILSAIACYLDRYVPGFAAFAAARDMRRPYHLTLTPELLAEFEKTHGAVDRAAVLAYQGPFADVEEMRKWDGRPLVAFGNHLFEHWNAAALNDEQFREQYLENETALAQFKSRCNLFAFTNGQPGSCFTGRELGHLQRLGAGKAFSSWSGVLEDPTQFLLGRLSLAEIDTDDDHLWFRLGRAAFARWRGADRMRALTLIPRA